MKTRDQEIKDLAKELFYVHHTLNLKFDNCSSDLREWYLLEADYLIREGYRKTDPSCPCEKLVPLDKNKLYGFIYSKQINHGGKSNRELFAELWSDEISSKFGTKPIVVPSVDDFINVILEVDNESPKGKKLVIEYATAIHAMLSKEVK